MSDGLSDYWADRFRRVSPRSEPWTPPLANGVWSADCKPIVPRYEPNVWDYGPDIDADAAIVWVNPPPFYFWLGKDAE